FERRLRGDEGSAGVGSGERRGLLTMSSLKRSRAAVSNMAYWRSLRWSAWPSSWAPRMSSNRDVTWADTSPRSDLVSGGSMDGVSLICSARSRVSCRKEAQATTAGTPWPWTVALGIVVFRRQQVDSGDVIAVGSSGYFRGF